MTTEHKSRGAGRDLLKKALAELPMIEVAKNLGDMTQKAVKAAGQNS